jgi:hypothetical protein
MLVNSQMHWTAPRHLGCDHVPPHVARNVILPLIRPLDCRSPTLKLLRVSPLACGYLRYFAMAFSWYFWWYSSVFVLFIGEI